MKLLFLLTVSVLCTTFSKAQSPGDAIAKGNAYYKEGLYDMAEKQYRIALQQQPTNAVAQYNLANAAYRQKKYDIAHGVLKKLQEGANNKELRAKAFYNDGVVYTKEKALENSIEAYKGALRINPDDKQARENLQKALQEQKKQQQQKKNEQKEQQKKEQNMSQKEADRQLKMLQQKEQQLQERMQKNAQKGGSMPKDW